MLVWWQKSRYKINYSHFFRGGWRGVLKWCNVRAHKIIISARTIDFWPPLTPGTDHISWLVAATFDLSLRCVWCIILLEKGKYCGVFRGEGCNTCDTYLFPLGWVFAIFCKQTWYCGAPPWAGMSCEKKGFSLQGQGHSVGLYNQNILLVLNQWVFCNQTQFEYRSL